MTEHPQLSTYKPGDLVLSRCVPYDPWPAVVIPVAYCPWNVLGSRTSTDQVLVRFLADRTFFWNDKDTISPLTPEKFKQFQEKKVKKGGAALKKAYKQAAEYTTDKFEKFLREIGILGKDDTFIKYEHYYSEGEEEEEQTEEVVKSKKKVKNGKKKSESVDASERPVKKAKVNKSPAVQEPEPEPTFEDLRRIAIGFRIKLQKGLLQRKDDPTEDELSRLSEIFKELEDFSDTIDIELLRASKLHKVLKAITKSKGLERPDDFKFHDRSYTILVKWADIIRQLHEEKVALGIADRTVTPNSSVLDIDTPKKEKVEEPKNIKLDTPVSQEETNPETKDVKEEQEEEEEVKLAEVENKDQEATKEVTAEAAQ